MKSLFFSNFMLMVCILYSKINCDIIVKLKKLNETNERTNGDPSIEPTFHCEKGPIHSLMKKNTFILALTKTFLIKIVNLLNKTSNEKSTEK